MDIFEETTSINESEEIVKRELLVFRRYELDFKDIKRLFQWWQKHEVMFPTIRFLAKQIFNVVRS